MSAFQCHREQQGFSVEQIAMNLDQSVKAYTDIEEGVAEPSRDFYIAYLDFMGLHAADLIIQDCGAMNPAFLNILLYHYEAYQSRDIENDLDVINQEKIDEIVSILAEESDAQWSYNRFIDEAHSCHEIIKNDEMKYDDIDCFSYSWLSRLTERLMVNDGNHNFLPSDMTAIEKKRVEYACNVSKIRLKKSSNALKINREQLDEVGRSLFGRQWGMHKRLLGVVYKQFDQSDFKDFFMNDMPWDDKNHSHEAKSALLGLFKSEKIHFNRLRQDASQFKRDRAIKDCFDGFLDSYGEALKIYENRQIIMQRAPDLVADYHGEPEHPNYMRPIISWDIKKLKQKPAGYLPKP